MPAAEPPIEPNEKPGLPVAAPKRFPDAGAVDVVLLLDAPEELVLPKLNDILGLRLVISWLESEELSVAVYLRRL